MIFSTFKFSSLFFHPQQYKCVALMRLLSSHVFARKLRFLSSKGHSFEYVPSVLSPYVEFAKNLQEVYHGTKISTVPLLDLAFGVASLCALKTRKRRQQEKYSVSYCGPLNFFHHSFYMSLHSHAVYLGIQGLLDTTHVRRKDIVASDWKGDLGGTSYYLVVDHSVRKIILAVRGTYSLRDTFVSLTVQPDSFLDGFAHRGALSCARHLHNLIFHNLKDIQAKYPDFEIFLTGHSLGAATAILLSLLLRPEFPGLHCFAYSPPP
eukprot:Sdes_comp9119_c0_seq1m583